MSSKLREAIEQAVIVPEQMEFSEAIPTEHIFSEKYTKNISKLIKRQKKSYYPLICTSARRVACIIAAFLIVSMTTVLSVDALRKPFFDFIVSIFSDHSEVRSVTEDSIDYPERITDIYEITYDISDYELVYSSENEKMLHKEYKYDRQTISFIQYTFDFGNANVNTENAIVDHVDIHSSDAMIWTDNNMLTHIIWNDGKYVFYITSSVSKDALIEIAKSVQIVE